MSSGPSRRPYLVLHGVVVLVQDGREVSRWPLSVPGEHRRPATQAPVTGLDLGAVDYLSRLQLAARRLGCQLRFAELCPRAVELLALAGLGDWVEVEG